MKIPWLTLLIPSKAFFWLNLKIISEITIHFLALPGIHWHTEKVERICKNEDVALPFHFFCLIIYYFLCLNRKIMHLTQPFSEFSWDFHQDENPTWFSNCLWCSIFQTMPISDQSSFYFVNHVYYGSSIHRHIVTYYACLSQSIMLI